MDDNKTVVSNEMSLVVQEVRSILDNAREKVARQVNNELLLTYWNIGRIMPNKEQLIRQVEAVLEKWHEGDKD